ncbi:HTH-type transcriptional repressor NsrR [mine drainage metagenome]|uniref:HTH-type transcriptional repressor NsrR n=1 Tax=mine drainage metagenome TaxID=410659 RepID=A0A1J5NXW4_9ZZZZ
MRLTQWSDYTLRVLMYCAANQNRTQPVTITEIADSHAISRSHLTKIVQELGSRGWLQTTRGRGGGIRLLVPARDIHLGDVVRATETDFTMVECFDPKLNQCRMSQHCKLKGVLEQATQSYLAVLDAVTLADLVPLSDAGLAATTEWISIHEFARQTTPTDGIKGLPQ